MTLESKTLQFKVKAAGTYTNNAGQQVGRIEAYGAIFGGVDEDGDRITKGAFTRTLKNNKARAMSRGTEYLAKMLWQHNKTDVIGGWFDISEDDKGLLGKGDVLLATQRGAEYFELAKAGMVDEFSIIYDIPQGGAAYGRDGVRELKELRLFSIDPVTWGANSDTEIVSVKSRKSIHDPAGTPPGEDGGKGAPMNRRNKANSPKEQKTYAEHFQQGMCEDILEDWQDVYLAPFTQAVLDAIKIGDQPEADVREALAAFGEQVLAWVALGQQYGLSDYLAAQSFDTSNADYLMQYGTDSRPDYGYMSRRTPVSYKAGRAISAANAEKIQGHIDTLNDMAKQHGKALRTVASDLATVIQGSEDLYVGTDDTPDAGQQEGKARPGTSARPALRSPQPPPSPDDTVDEVELATAFAKLATLNVK